MTPDEIIEALTSYTGRFPREAVQAATEQLAEVAELLLASLDAAVTDPDRVIAEDGMLHMYALYLLGHARDQRAFLPLVRMAHLPETQVDGLLGDTITEQLSIALASTCPDWELLKPLVEDVDAYEYCRSAALEAMMCMVAEGNLDPSQVLEYCYHLLNGGMARDDSYVWCGLFSAAVDLGVGPCEPALRSIYREGPVGPDYISPEEVEQLLSDPKPRYAMTYERMHYRYLKDCVSEMSWWAAFAVSESYRETRDFPGEEPNWLPEYRHVALDRVPYVRESPKVGRNDPCPCGSGKKFKKCCG